jgi:hypothetical protein
MSYGLPLKKSIKKGESITKRFNPIPLQEYRRVPLQLHPKKKLLHQAVAVVQDVAVTN